MRVVMLGATRGMGRALSRALAERGESLHLLGRHADDLAKSAADLELRGARAPVTHGLCDLLRVDGFTDALQEAERALGGLDCVIVTAALFASQEALEKDPEQRDQLLTANFTHTVAFCEEARSRLLAGGGGSLCVFSSVAGDRARKPVILYGAAKAGLSHYLEGLDHKFRARGLHTLLVKPGFVRTGMTADLDPPPFAGEVDAVAARVLRALDHRRPLVYVPAPWRLVMAVVRALPRALMRRLEF